MSNCPNCHGYGVVTYYRGQQAWIEACKCGAQKLVPPPFFWTREYSPYPEALIKRRIAQQDAEARDRLAVIEKYRRPA